MAEVVKIGCTKCGAVLSVQYTQGIESKNVTCPICKNKGPFSSFRRIDDKPDDGNTQIPDTLTKNSDSAQAIGTLLIDGQKYPLKLGRNVIGRKASGNNADIQIPANVSTKRMSRQHVVIDVKQLGEGCYQHQISLYKPEVNSTYLNNDKINYGDTLLLLNNFTIKFPDCDAKFTIESPEQTCIDN